MISSCQCSKAGQGYSMRHSITLAAQLLLVTYLFIPRSPLSGLLSFFAFVLRSLDHQPIGLHLTNLHYTTIKNLAVSKICFSKRNYSYNYYYISFGMDALF